MPVIMLPNGQNAEFPDDMHPDQIKAVLRQKFPPTNAQPPAQVKPESVDTFLGKMPNQSPREILDQVQSPENVKGLIEGLAGNPGMQMIGGLRGLYGAGKSALQTAKSATDMLPGKTSQKFIQGLGEVPSEINTQRVANTMNTGYEMNKANALKHKDVILKEIGKESVPISEGKYLAKEGEDLANQEVFNSFKPSLKKLHSRVVDDPTYSNADKLLSDLKSEGRRLGRLAKEGKLDQAGGIHLEEVNRVRADLEHDLDSFLESKAPHLKPENEAFKKKWRENVVPYTPTTRMAEISKGETQGVTPSELRGLFSFPDENVQKILGDFPKEAKNYLLYNELNHINPKNAEAILDRLNELERSKGYAHLMSPEIQAFKKEIKRKLLGRNVLSGLAGTGLGMMTGNPWAGAFLGAIPTVKNPAFKILQGLMKR